MNNIRQQYIGWLEPNTLKYAAYCIITLIDSWFVSGVMLQFLMFVNVFENVLFISITLPLNYGEKEKGPRPTMFNIIEPRVRVPVQEQCPGSIFQGLDF